MIKEKKKTALIVYGNDIPHEELNIVCSNLIKLNRLPVLALRKDLTSETIVKVFRLLDMVDILHVIPAKDGSYPTYLDDVLQHARRIGKPVVFERVYDGEWVGVKDFEPIVPQGYALVGNSRKYSVVPFIISDVYYNNLDFFKGDKKFYLPDNTILVWKYNPDSGVRGSTEDAIDPIINMYNTADDLMTAASRLRIF